MTRYSLLAGFFFLAALASAPAAAGAATDQAPSSAEQMSNPSKAEPMMIEPTPADEAAAYRRDLADCARHSPEGQQICREMVDEQYGVGASESSQALARCESLQGAARQECLRGVRSEATEPRSVKSRMIKKEAGHRPGFLA